MIKVNVNYDGRWVHSKRGRASWKMEERKTEEKEFERGESDREREG